MFWKRRHDPVLDPHGYAVELQQAVEMENRRKAEDEREQRLVAAFERIAAALEQREDPPSPGIREVLSVPLGPDDVIVLRHPGKVSMEAQNGLTASLRPIFGESRKIICLEEGMDLEVLHKEGP